MRDKANQTGPGQASILFVLAGTLGLISELFLDAAATLRVASIALNLSAITLGVVIRFLPWSRWPSRAALAVVPPAFALLALGQRVAPGAPTVYGVWFIVVFAWIGFWYPPRTGLAFVPMAAVAYVAPFVGVASTPTDAIASVAIALPAGAFLGEVIASKMREIQRAQDELIEARTLLERANLTDDLTGVGNRRRANALLDSMQHGDGLVVLDLDHFKRVNDTRGHAEGDRLLGQFGEFLRNAVREADTVARFGGEEFLVVLRGTGHQVGEVADRLLAGWRAQGTGVTLSAGGAAHRQERGPGDTFRAADQALYEAKRRRDCFALESAPASVEEPAA
jgi:diguanylate cyclase (GGDEF)-like protein